VLADVSLVLSNAPLVLVVLLLKTLALLNLRRQVQVSSLDLLVTLRKLLDALLNLIVYRLKLLVLLLKLLRLL